MMKKIMMLALAALLLCTAALAEEEAYVRITDALYRIVQRTENGDVTLGSGVLFSNQHVLLTAGSCCPEGGTLVAIGEDGEHQVNASVARGGAALLQLVEPSTAQPLELSTYEAEAVGFLFGASMEDELAVAPLYQARLARYGELEGMLLSSEECMLPGAVMVDEAGGILGLTLSQQMEGVGTYMALSPGGISAAVLGNAGKTFLDVQFGWENGQLKINWKDEKRSDGLYIVYITAAENQYYETLEAAHNERSMSVPVPPGHTYEVQVHWAKNAESAEPIDLDMLSTYSVPDWAFFGYGYAQRCCIVSVPENDRQVIEREAMPAITASTLLAEKQHPCLQVVYSHQFPENVELLMVAELIAPDGQFHYEDMTLTLEAKRQEGVFAIALDNMLADCIAFSEEESLPMGEYRVRYALGGRIAGEYTFTLSETETVPEVTETPAPAAEEPEQDGQTMLLTGITATYDAGYVHVTWPAEAVPEGAHVMACALYENNDHVTYYDIRPGETSLDFYNVPGRQMVIWVCWAQDEAASPRFPTKPEECVILPAQEEQPYTAHGFRNLRSGLTMSVLSEPEASTAFLPEIDITREVLQDEHFRLCFQTEDCYEIAEESLEHALLFAFSTPEGYVFISEGYYSFYPEYAASDLWVKDLSSITQSYCGMIGDAAWPAGEYTLTYLIDGMVAAEVSFILE